MDRIAFRRLLAVGGLSGALLLGLTHFGTCGSAGLWTDSLKLSWDGIFAARKQISTACSESCQRTAFVVKQEPGLTLSQGALACREHDDCSKDKFCHDCGYQKPAAANLVTGAKLHALWDGSWWPAEIAGIKGSGAKAEYLIHYTGYACNFDEWLSADKLSTRKPEYWARCSSDGNCSSISPGSYLRHKCQTDSEPKNLCYHCRVKHSHSQNSFEHSYDSATHHVDGAAAQCGLSDNSAAAGSGSGPKSNN